MLSKTCLNCKLPLFQFGTFIKTICFNLRNHSKCNVTLTVKVLALIRYSIRPKISCKECLLKWMSLVDLGRALHISSLPQACRSLGCRGGRSVSPISTGDCTLILLLSTPSGFSDLPTALHFLGFPICTKRNAQKDWSQATSDDCDWFCESTIDDGFCVQKPDNHYKVTSALSAYFVAYILV